jgi:nitrogen regulatory protein PII
MKEIKAYVRRDCVNKLVTALEEASAPGITIVEHSSSWLWIRTELF